MGCLGASGGMVVFPHAHAHTHMYTCIEIANGHQHRGIHVYHVKHACVCMHVCVHACMHAWNIPHRPIPAPFPSSYLPPPGGTPRISQN